jgi:hypothetical protein
MQMRIPMPATVFAIEPIDITAPEMTMRDEGLIVCPLHVVLAGVIGGC